MKMKNVFSMKTLSVAAVAAIALLYSCKKDNDSILSSTDSQNVNSESVSSSTSSEAADLGNSVISNVSDTKLSQARVSGEITGLGDKDRRLIGATITISGTGTKDNPSGTITINYGTAGVTTDGVTRKGVITITYNGRRLQPGSTRSITFTSFTRNGVQVSGTYTVSVTDSTKTSTDVVITFTHQTQITLTFTADGSTITRNSNVTVVWDYNINTPTQSTITHKASTGNVTAYGKTRKDKEYTMTITKDLIYRLDCFAAGFALPYTGTKTIAVTGGNTYTIDYGTTTCDNTVTITLNGRTETVTVRGDGN